MELIQTAATVAANPEDYNPNVSPNVVGYVTKATFGNADATMYFHIYGHDETIQEFIPLPGNAPFTVQLKIDGNLVRTITDVPACENYAYTNVDPAAGPLCEFNCVIENIPVGAYDMVITDAIGNDCRAMQHVFEVQPPYGTVNGSVDPNGLETHVWFEFGETDAYGRSADFGFINGWNPVTCSLRLEGKVPDGTPIQVLEAGKTYHYRICSQNSAGSSFGEDMSFTVPMVAGAPEAHTLPATNVVGA